MRQSSNTSHKREARLTAGVQRYTSGDGRIILDLLLAKERGRFCRKCAAPVADGHHQPRKVDCFRDKQSQMVVQEVVKSSRYNKSTYSQREAGQATTSQGH